jgi:hypothetical protein
VAGGPLAQTERSEAQREDEARDAETQRSSSGRPRIDAQRVGGARHTRALRGGHLIA